MKAFTCVVLNTWYLSWEKCSGTEEVMCFMSLVCLGQTEKELAHLQKLKPRQQKSLGKRRPSPALTA